MAERLEGEWLIHAPRVHIISRNFSESMRLIARFVIDCKSPRLAREDGALAVAREMGERLCMRPSNGIQVAISRDYWTINWLLVFVETSGCSQIGNCLI